MEEIKEVCPKQIEEKKGIWAWFKKNRDAILTCLTLVLCVLTFLSIITMINLGEIEQKLINATDKIGEIQLYLAKDVEKKETLEQINLANELMIELIHNKNELISISLVLPSLKNRTESRDDDFRTTKAETAINSINFGSSIMDLKLPAYLEAINKIKDDLGEIRLSQSRGQINIKTERIDRAVGIAKDILYTGYRSDIATIVRIDEVFNATRDYSKERLTHYSLIDKKIEEGLAD